MLTQDGNVEGLGRLNATSVDRAMKNTAHRRVIGYGTLISFGLPFEPERLYGKSPF